MGLSCCLGPCCIQSCRQFTNFPCVASRATQFELPALCNAKWRRWQSFCCIIAGAALLVRGGQQKQSKYSEEETEKINSTRLYKLWQCCAQCWVRTGTTRKRRIHLRLWTKSIKKFQLQNAKRMRRSKVEAAWEETALTTTSSQFTWRLHSPCCATFFMIARDSYFIKSKAAPNVSCRGFMHISWAPGTVSTQGHRERVCVYAVFVSAWGLLHVISVLRRFSVFVVLWFFCPLRRKIPKV